jgi:hypothetical protein
MPTLKPVLLPSVGHSAPCPSCMPSEKGLGLFVWKEILEGGGGSTSDRNTIKLRPRTLFGRSRTTLNPASRRESSPTGRHDSSRLIRRAAHGKSSEQNYYPSTSSCWFARCDLLNTTTMSPCLQLVAWQIHCEWNNAKYLAAQRSNSC